MIRFCAAVFTALMLTACGQQGGSDTGGQADPSKTRVPVGVASVSRDSLVERLTLTGRLTPRPGGASLLTAPAAGVVRSLRVQIGDTVKRGEVVADLDVPELAADARQKEAAAAQADREAQRQQRLLQEGITSSRQAEEAAANAHQAAAGAAAARDLLARTRVTSPISGVVQDVLVQQGERVDPGKPLVQIVAADTLDLVASVPATQLGRLRVGLPAAVAQEGDSSHTMGRVAALTPGVDSLTNAGAAVVRIPNPAGQLHPGAGATAKVRLGVHRDVLVVPDSAIVLAGDTSVVFVVGSDSIAHQRTVIRGVGDDRRSEVQGDLKAGDQVVTTGAFGLQDGMRVVPGRNAGPPRSQRP
jgi:membrane fusion protein (multidrug efflux system)